MKAPVIRMAGGAVALLIMGLGCQPVPKANMIHILQEVYDLLCNVL